MGANNQDSASEDQVDVSWPRWRIGAVVGGAILSVVALASLIIYAIYCHPKPSELGVPSVLLI